MDFNHQNRNVFSRSNKEKFEIVNTKLQCYYRFKKRGYTFNT